MFILTVEIRVNEANADDFAAAIARQAEASVAEEPGCHQFQVSRSVDDPRLFLLYEAYSEKAAFDQHCELPRSKASGERTNPWIESTKIQSWTAI